MADLAIILWASGRVDEAHDATGGALDLYERKGNTAAADRLRARVVALRPV
jgi:hypothetical protein